MKAERAKKPERNWRCMTCKALHGYYPVAGACQTKGCKGTVREVPFANC